jgi:hypothetical protein
MSNDNVHVGTILFLLGKVAGVRVVVGLALEWASMLVIACRARPIAMVGHRLLYNTVARPLQC